MQLAPAANLSDRFLAHWRAEPGRRVLRDVDGRWLTAGELDNLCGAAAQRLGGAGLAPGDRLLLIGAPSAAFVINYLGALRAGVVTVPVNPAYTRPELERIAADCRPAAAVVEDDERAGWLRSLGVPVPEPAVSSATIDAARLEDAAVMMYTSGTTGAPKGAPLTHGNLLASAEALRLAWRLSGEDTLLLALPLFHMHGLGVGVGATFAAGGRIVLRPGFDAADVAACCAAGVTLFFGVPAMYQRLLASGRAGALAGLRLLVSGSAPLPEALSAAVATEAGQVPLERYGMTETVMLTSNPIDGPRKPGKVGLPLPGVSLRLAEGGEVQVRGPNVFGGYFERPEADAEAFTADRWFRTGDLGELDEDGHLRLVGRAKELIITGGLNVHPREVEEVLADFPGVVEVAVVGRPSEEWGEAVTAVVVAAGTLDAGELRAFAATRLAPYKVPKAVELVEALPRNALGKVVRSEL